MLNSKDAPEGFFAMQANPKYLCMGCHWEHKHDECCPHVNDDEICQAKTRKDGLSVIFIKEES